MARSFLEITPIVGKTSYWGELGMICLSVQTYRERNLCFMSTKLQLSPYLCSAQSAVISWGMIPTIPRGIVAGGLDDDNV